MFAYWKLNETSGTTYDDFYDGHDGGCAGVCPDPAAGRLDGGQEFNGSNTGINVPAPLAAGHNDSGGLITGNFSNSANVPEDGNVENLGAHRQSTCHHACSSAAN